MSGVCSIELYVNVSDATPTSLFTFRLKLGPWINSKSSSISTSSISYSTLYACGVDISSTIHSVSLTEKLGGKGSYSFINTVSCWSIVVGVTSILLAITCWLLPKLSWKSTK